MKTVVLIPAYNEEKSITKVIESIPGEWVQRILVVDNASTDQTAELAKQAGGEVVFEERRGYGRACLKGISEAKDSEIIVFLDADYSDDPAQLPNLIQPIIDNKADLVIGSRIKGKSEKGALPNHAKFGNILACYLIKQLFGVSFTDLGPFRAIRTQSLLDLEMEDQDYGWTVEMQAKAAILGLRCCEVPVPYKIRIGQSKISGTIQGSIKAGCKILWTIFRLWMKQKSMKKRRTV